MRYYRVVRKSDSQEIYRYCSDDPVEWNGMSFSEHDHILVDEEEVPSPPAPTGPRRLTKLQFIDRLGDTAYVSILALAKDNVLVEAFIKRFEMATPEADYTSIDLDDPRTVGGVTQIGAVLEADGKVSSEWVSEVLK